MKQYQWNDKNDSWPSKKRYLLLDTNHGLWIGHTNSTEDVIFDACIILVSNDCKQLDFTKWKYITKTQHIFLMDNLESFHKFNEK